MYSLSSNELYDFEKRWIQTFLQSQVDGVLASISKKHQSRPLFGLYLNVVFPYTVWPHQRRTWWFHRWWYDYTGASRQQNIWWTGLPPDSTYRRSAARRHLTSVLKGYIDALNVHNIAVDEDLIVYGNWVSNQGVPVCSNFWRADRCPNQCLLLKILQRSVRCSCKYAGLTIPADVSIIGFATRRLVNIYSIIVNGKPTN